MPGVKTGAPPPPPPPGAIKGLSAQKNVNIVNGVGNTGRSEIVKLFQSTMRQHMKKERTGKDGDKTKSSPEFSGQTRGEAQPGDVKGELEQKSNYMAKIKQDVNSHGPMINYMAKEIRGFNGGAQVLMEFMKSVESKLAMLSDELQVLRHFEKWPEAKVEAMREACALVQELEKTATGLKAWEKKGAELATSDKYNAMDAIVEGFNEMDKVQPRIENLMRGMKTMQDKFNKLRIEIDINDYVSRIKENSSVMALAVMNLTLQHFSQDKAQMLRSFKFSFRVYQFAEKFSEEATSVFRALHDELQVLIK